MSAGIAESGWAEAVEKLYGDGGRGAKRERYFGVRRSTAKGIRAFSDLCGERRDLGFYIGYCVVRTIRTFSRHIS